MNNVAACFNFIRSEYDPYNETNVTYWIPGTSIEEDQYLIIPEVEDVVENPAPFVDFAQYSA